MPEVASQGRTPIRPFRTRLRTSLLILPAYVLLNWGIGKLFFGNPWPLVVGSTVGWFTVSLLPTKTRPAHAETK